MKITEVLFELAAPRVYQPHDPVGRENWRRLRDAYKEQKPVVFVFDNTEMPPMPIEAVNALYDWCQSWFKKNNHAKVYNKLGSSFFEINRMTSELYRRLPKQANEHK